MMHMLCTPWEESCSLLDPEKPSGGFLRAKARGVTWGWCVHELSTTLVQIPGLSIGPGHCQLSSVTWTPRGSSCGQHPSCCSLACVKQLLMQTPLLGLSVQHPPDSWWRSHSTFLQLEQRLPCTVACFLRDMSHSAGILLSSLQAAWTSTRQNHKSLPPDPCHPGPSSAYSTLQKSLWNLLWKTQILHKSQGKLDSHFRNLKKNKSCQEQNSTQQNFLLQFQGDIHKTWTCLIYFGKALLSGGEVLAATVSPSPTSSAEIQLLGFLAKAHNLWWG